VHLQPHPWIAGAGEQWHNIYDVFCRLISAKLKRQIMKKVMLGFCMLLGSAVAVCAQDATTTTPVPQDQYRTQDDQDKEVIATSELPAKVREQIQGQDYSGWTVSQAYRKQKDGKTVYAVELVNGAEKKMVKFDAEGNKLKEKKKE
jgi:uncharacterized membrane protein YkoI